MKTLTEFSGFTLKEAIAKKAALLAEGKTEEEATAAINEQLKLDETKVSFYKNAVDMTNSRRDQVKRVVIAVKASETEKVPENFVEREGHFYLVEYFGSATPARSSYSDARGGRGDRGRGGRGGDRNDRGGGGRGRDGGRGGDRDGRRDSRGESSGDRPRREPRPPREQPAPNPNAASFVSTGLGTLAPRPAKPAAEKRPRNPKGPRPPRNNDNRGPKGAGELRLVLKGQSATTLQGSGVAPAVPAAETPAASEAPQA